MRARKKRKPDFRRIGPSQTYSIAELAKAVDRDSATVRRWIREGMPAMDQQKPLIIDGANAKEWLREKWTQRKQPCEPNEAHCVRCRKPQAFADGSRSIRQNTNKVLLISGECAVCGSRINKFASAASVAILDPGNERTRENSAA